MQPVVVFRLSKFRKRILFAFAFVAFIFGTSFGGGGVSAADVDDDGGAKASSQCVANVPKWRQTNLCQKNLVIFAHDTEFYGSLTVKKKFFMTLLNGEEIEVGRKIAEQDEEMDELVDEVKRLTQELTAVKMTCLAVKEKQSEVYQPPSPPPNPPPPSPPPSPNPPPNPPSPLDPITDANWHAFVEACLSEVGAEVTGECTEWASGNNYGTMPNWDTSLVTDMSSTFSSRASFDADISKWDISSVTDLGSIFYSASSFNQDIGGWNTEKVTDMESVFDQAEVFDQDLSSWDTSQVTTMRSMFHRAYRFNQNIINWDVSLVMDMNGMFGYATMFEQGILSWPSGDNINQGYIFYGENMAIHTQIECDSPFWHGPLTSCRYRTTSRFFTFDAIPDASWHAFVAECLDEAPVTGECTEWASGNNYGTMPNWDTSLVTDMSSTFSSRASFDADISKWDTGQVNTTYAMFYRASEFNKDIGSWNTEKVTIMSTMFYEAFLFNQDIGGWNTEKVTDMGLMFQSARAFNKDIGSWNTEKVTSMRAMFQHAYVFNQDIGRWNTSQVTVMHSMFPYAYAFNHDISSWTGSAATSEQTNMFLYAHAFQAKFTCTNAVTGPASSCVLK